MEGGFFRQESPWLPGMRKIKSQQPVELTSVSAVKDPPGGDQSSESPAGDPPDDGGVPGQDEASGQPPDRESPARESASASPPPDKNGVSVSGLTASWKGSAEEPTLTDISFELTEVRLCHEDQCKHGLVHMLLMLLYLCSKERDGGGGIILWLEENIYQMRFI